MSRIVGIDLGTTNSLVAHVEGGIPRVIPDAEGRTLLPSIVAWTNNGVVVGEAARRQLARNSARTVYSVKRLMGRGYEDVKDDLSRLPFEVTPQAEVVSIRIGDRAVTPPEVSAHVLRALKQRAEGHFGEPIEQAVITVPAYFNDAQRQATKDAGRIAGLEVLRIVNEPTAAALAYGLQKLSQGVIAVYDLGGGTFDISILRVKDGVFEVLATNGNTHLGGDDFDRMMVDWLLADIKSRHRVDLSGDAEAVQEVRLGAEAAKCRLSFDERTVLTMPPRVSIPSESGVTSSSSMSVMPPARICAWTAAPRATTSSGFMRLCGVRPNSSSTRRCTSGIRVEPPTSTTSSTWSGRSAASARA